MFSTHDCRRVHTADDEAMFQDVLAVLAHPCKKKRHHRPPPPPSHEKKPSKRVRITPFRRIKALQAQVDELTRHRDRLRHTKRVRRESFPSGQLIEAALQEQAALLRKKDQLANVIVNLQADLFPRHFWCLPPPIQIKQEPLFGIGYAMDSPYSLDALPSYSLDDIKSLLTSFDPTPSIYARIPPPYCPTMTGRDLDFVKMECL